MQYRGEDIFSAVILAFVIFNVVIFATLIRYREKKLELFIIGRFE